MRREALMRLFAIFVIGTSCFGQSPQSTLPFSSTAQSQTEGTDSLPKLPQAASVGWLGSSSADQDARERGELQFVPPTFSIEPNNGQQWHTLDAKFITLHALSTAALIADSVTTLRGLKENPNATELDPLFGKHPTPGRLFGIAVPLQIFNICLSYHLKKIAPRRSDWKLAPRLSIALHTFGAANNLVVMR